MLNVLFDADVGLDSDRDAPFGPDRGGALLGEGTMDVRQDDGVAETSERAGGGCSLSDPVRGIVAVVGGGAGETRPSRSIIETPCGEKAGAGRQRLVGPVMSTVPLRLYVQAMDAIDEAHSRSALAGRGAVVSSMCVRPAASHPGADWK
ncbi:hypothetical protein ACFC4G_45595 [Streptomyces sp. NPDC056002]|uniref:hypothetical protein n=1 Tax=Streptomyces sp. NPDC056002 TaxID=3345675 RepID=UPI0035D8D800